MMLKNEANFKLERTKNFRQLCHCRVPNIFHIRQQKKSARMSAKSIQLNAKVTITPRVKLGHDITNFVRFFGYTRMQD